MPKSYANTSQVDRDEGRRRDFVDQVWRSLDHWVQCEYFRRADRGQCCSFDPGRDAAVAAYIENCFWRGLSLELVRMDFAEFRLRALGLKIGWPLTWAEAKAKKVRQTRRRRRGTPGDTPFREGLAYRRDRSHVSVPLDVPSPKTCWRVATSLKRDKAKAGDSWLHGVRCRRFFQKMSASQHRAWVRASMARGDYEVFSNNEYLEFADRWLWD